MFIRQVGPTPTSAEEVYMLRLRNPIATLVNLRNLNRMQTHLLRIFQQIVSHVDLRRNVIARRGSMSVRVRDASTGRNVRTPLRVMRNITDIRALARSIFSNMQRALQSFETFNIRETEIRIQWSVPLRAAGYTPRYPDVIAFIKDKKAIVELPRDSGMCFHMCIRLGKAQSENTLDEYRKLVKAKARYMRKEFTGLAPVTSITDQRALARENGLALMIIELQTLNIRYFDDKFKGKLLVVGEEIHNENVHWHYINRNKVGSLWGRPKFCFTCMTAYKSIKHKCIAKCIACESPECVHQNERDIGKAHATCSTCYRQFFDNECKKLHKCGTKRKCMFCERIYEKNPKHPHKCGHVVCKNCRVEDKLFEHKCYIQKKQRKNGMKVTKKGEVIKAKYAYYDIETYMNEEKEHVFFCLVCSIDGDDTMKVFYDMDEFVTWAMKQKGVSFIAHNAAKYDAHFVKRCLIKFRIPSNDIVQGHQLLEIRLPKCNVRFIDSYRFIPTSLRAMPKTFGLKQDGMAKGVFPYEFMKRDTLDYRGPIPEKKWFKFAEIRDKKERLLAETWYDSFEGREYNLHEECVKYCKQDVYVLRKACEAFQTQMLRIAEIDPFQYLTIASVAMGFWRDAYLEEKNLALEFDTGYEVSAAIEHIEAKQEKLEKLPAEMVGEYNNCTILGVGVVTRSVHVYAPCQLSGCENCFARWSYNIQGEFMHYLDYVFKSIIGEIEDLTRRKVVVWRECELDEKKAFENVCTTAVRVKDAFFGGRTETVSQLYKAKENEEIRYYDYTSLYPSIQANVHNPVASTGIRKDDFEYNYPVGHGKRMKPCEMTKPLSEYMGFACVDLEPPDNLHMPLLPRRVDGKLVFDLERRTQTYTIVEITKAIKLGYIVRRIVELYVYEESSTTLFKPYVCKFLRVKLIAAGRKGKSEEEVKKMTGQWKKNLGIEVDPKEIPEERNDAMYFIAKMFLNSLWGKFAQRGNLPNSKDTYTAAEFASLVHDDSNEVLSLFFHDNGARTVTYKKKHATSRPSLTANLAIAAFTTSYARLRLYESLELIGKNDVLYMDTDSIIYVVRDGMNPLKCGPSLGDLTDELIDKTGERYWITDFVSTGPKSYAYRLNSGKECVKVKGFCISPTANIGVDSLEQLVTSTVDKIAIPQTTFLIQDDHTIKTHPCNKLFKLSGHKRDFELNEDGDIISSPFPKRLKIQHNRVTPSRGDCEEERENGE